ncbi:MAG: universal stress protein, partial [Bdellovibrionales bacterium]|nr:universal stress protein [Bdellovibrionales bacterium]
LGPQAQKTFDPLKNKSLKIFVATDLTKESRAVETYALSFAKKIKAEVILYHSISEHVESFKETAYVTTYGEFSVEEYKEELISDIKKVLESKKNQFKKNKVSCEFIIDSKNIPIGKSLIEYSKGCDFIFLGTQSQGAAISAFIGSTLRYVLAVSKVSIVSVHKKY